MSNVSMRCRVACIAKYIFHKSHPVAAASVVACSIFSATAVADEPGAATARPQLSERAAATFQQRCTSCHTFGKGTKVGPDLRGIADRRNRKWLIRFIRSSSSLIASGDTVAAALFAEFKGQRMPDWSDLPEKEVADIVDYLAAGAPEQKPLDERGADTATAAEKALGSRLFDGTAPFEHAAQRCNLCHTARGQDRIAGGSLGPDLGAACARYGERELTSLLGRPCFAWDPQPARDRYLTPGESFALKAFLCSQPLATARAPRPEAGGGSR
jgi:cytochrome c2